MKYKLSVIIPCLNEAVNLPEIIDRLLVVFKKRNIVGQIVIIDDCSTDSTQDILKDLKNRHDNIISYRNEYNMGIIKSYEAGLSLSEGEYVSFIDADLQYLPEDIWRLYREIEYSKSDIVQGFRSYIKRPHNSHVYLNKLTNVLLNLLFKTRLRDPSSSFLISRKVILDDILSISNKSYNFFQTLIVATAKTRGYTIREVETLFQKRLIGKNSIGDFSLKNTLRSLKDIFALYLNLKVYNNRDTLLTEFLKKNPVTRKTDNLSLIRRIVFKLFIYTMPIHHWMISKDAGKYYDELNSSQWLSSDSMKKLQETKLRKLIFQAYNHVQYYRDIFDKLNISPSDIQTIEDLQKLPFLSKQDVRENLYFDMLSDNHDKKKILKISTSGSTGEPFVCFADKHQLEIRWASTLRSVEWTGYKFGDKQIRLWHQTLGMSFTQVIRERIDAILNRRTFIPAFEMSDKSLRNFASIVNRVKPTFIDGYAESFNFLAEYLKDYNFNSSTLKGIMSSAQTLPAQSREIIEKKFKCRVFDKYGSREFSGIAYECGEHDGHHVVAESYIVEIIKNGKPAKPGEVGEVVVTDLNNFCMPLIRYRVGDLATAVDNSITCKCGRGLPRIGDIDGRIQAIIVGSNGHYIPGTFFAHFFKDYNYIIKQYQVLQEASGNIILKIVKTQMFDRNAFDKIIKKLLIVLGEKTIINIEFVDKIELVRTGKHQGSISKIKFDFQKTDIDIKK